MRTVISVSALNFLFYLCIDDKYQGPSSSENHLIVKGWIKKVHLSREVPDLEIDKGAAGDVIFIDLVGALEKQGLIGGHLMKHHLISQIHVVH